MSGTVTVSSGSRVSVEDPPVRPTRRLPPRFGPLVLAVVVDVVDDELLLVPQALSPSAAAPASPAVAAESFRNPRRVWDCKGPTSFTSPSFVQRFTRSACYADCRAGSRTAGNVSELATLTTASTSSCRRSRKRSAGTEIENVATTTPSSTTGAAAQHTPGLELLLVDCIAVRPDLVELRLEQLAVHDRPRGDLPERVGSRDRRRGAPRWRAPTAAFQSPGRAHRCTARGGARPGRAAARRPRPAPGCRPGARQRRMTSRRLLPRAVAMAREDIPER